MKETSLEDLDLSVFAALVNSTFRVRQETGAPIELILAEAKPVGKAEASSTAQARSFSLVFHGPDRFPLPQQMLTVEHERVGRFALFLVPVGKGHGVIEYQAVFNRMT
jgi:hypothetical protein